MGHPPAGEKLREITVEETPVYGATSKCKIAGGISYGLTRTKTFHTNYSLKNAKMRTLDIIERIGDDRTTI